MPLRPTVARYAVAIQSPPQLTETIVLADRVHAALVSLSGGSSIFTGCDEQGRPLQGNRHAHVFCESNNALGKGTGGEITHIIIYAPLLLLGLGLPQDIGGLDLERGQCPLLACSRTWVSCTPFVPTRHPKVMRAGVPKRDASGSQIGSPENELRRLLGLAGFPEPVAVEPVPGTTLGGRESAVIAVYDFDDLSISEKKLGQA